MKKIFVPGGAGYIGSHTVLDLLKQDYDVTVFDNLANASLANLEKVQEIAGKKVEFIKGDLRNFEEVAAALRPEHEAVIHFAALKSVVDSYGNPFNYYQNNIGGTLYLLKAMKDKGVKNIIFSSTGAVYGQPEKLPVSETMSVKPASVYARTKAIVEQILDDMQTEGLNSVRLRYFNVAGADPTGLIGEDPDAMGNLIPRIFASLIGKHDLRIYGNNFPTRDGYQIRDYIHVADLAAAHVSAIKYLEAHRGTSVFNLGVGSGTTVMELIKAVEVVTGRKVNYTVADPQPGENIEIFADAAQAKAELGWAAKHDYHDIIRDAWNWYRTTPEFLSLS